MYLVEPRRLLWTSIGHISPEKIIQMGGNLEAIDSWEPASRPLRNSDIEVALRYGIPIRAGLVVDAAYILDQERARELYEVHEKARKAQQHPTIQATDEYIDKYLIPGWKQQGDELNQKIDEDSASMIREAQEEAARQLEVPIRPELVDHWQSIGGIIPA
jgi:hypothetical protein